MNIDWFTFAAQIVNFLVLVALLRYFLYRPVVDAMQRREDKIADRLKQAERQRAEAESRAEEYDRKSREVDARREEMLDGARQEADETRQRMLSDARDQIDQQRDQWYAALRHEQEDLVREIRDRAGRLSLDAARKLVVQLSNADFEDSMINAFVSRLQSLSEQDRSDIQQRLQEGSGSLSFRTAFPLSEQRQQELREALRNQLQFDGELAFSTSADMICGVELQSDGYRLGWNVQDFLGDLQEEFTERLQHQ